MEVSPDEYDFIRAWPKIQQQVYNVNVDNGWWESERNNGELIALIHSELSEALEWLRKSKVEKDYSGNEFKILAPSDHIPDISGVEEELADTVIRIMDFCFANHLDIAPAIIKKIRFNKGRGHKHGGKAF